MDSGHSDQSSSASSVSVEQLLQVRREQRDHLTGLPQRRKLAKLASCRHCDVAGCRCPGWIPSSLNDGDSSEVESRASSDASVLQNCKTCHHELEEHGCSDLADKSNELIFGLVCLSQDVVSLYSSVQNQVDPDAKQIYFYVYKQLRRSLDMLTIPSQPLFKPTPPFEQPSISRLLANFVHSRFISASAASSSPQQVSQEDAVQMASLFLDVFDVWQIPVPSQLLSKLTKDKDYDFTSLFNNDQNELLSWYRTAFSQWLCHCRIPAISARLTMPCWRATAVFGIKLFRCTFPLFRDDLIAHCKAEKSQRDMLTKLMRFLNLMQTDLRNENAPWLQSSYSERSSVSAFSPKFLQAPALIDAGIAASSQEDGSTGGGQAAKSVQTAKTRKRRQSTSSSYPGQSSKVIKQEHHHHEFTASNIPGDIPHGVVTELLKECPLTEFAPHVVQHQAVPSVGGVPVHRLATAMRDERARLDYQSGILSVHVVNNNACLSSDISSSSGDDAARTELSMFLLAAQNIFTAQLPRMPRPYVSRLVFDPKHRTLVLVKRTEPSTPVSLQQQQAASVNSSISAATPSTTNATGGSNTNGNSNGGSNGSGSICNRRAIGAICFCAFPSRQFSEVVFCAVSAEEQVRGFGTFMMSCLKEWHVQHGYKHLLTFADEFAVGYFLKQGFSADFNLPRSHYEGFIKEYEGATLMACELQPRVPYTHLTIGIRQVRRIIEALAVRRRREVVVRRPGLSCFGDGVRQIPIESIPGAVEAGWSDETAGEDGQELAGDPDSLYSNLRQVLNQVKAHPSSWPFLKPVDRSEAPDYYEVIKWPMDLKTVADRLKSRYYHHRRLFLADFARMFENCRAYNAPPTEYYKCANTLEKFFLQKMREVELLTTG